MTEQFANVKLDFEQRNRASRLEELVHSDPYSAAHELVWLRDEVERLRSQLLEHSEVCKESAQPLTALRTDAELYRWLRNTDDDDDAMIVDKRGRHVTGDACDRVVEAARGAK